MPLTITVAEIAAAIRLGVNPNDPPVEPELGILTRQWAVARDRIDGYAPLAPQETQNEAAVRLIGYYFDRPESVDPFRSSGALALLHPYHSLITVTLGAVAAAAVPSVATPEAGINPAQPVHPGTHTRYVGWSDDTTVTLADIQAGNSSGSGYITIPAHANNAYLFFVVPQSVGYPTSLIIGGNSFNQISAYVQQAGTIDVGVEPHLVGLNTNLLDVSLFAGKIMTLGH